MISSLIYLKTDDKTILGRISKRGVDFKNKKDIKSSCSTEVTEVFDSFKNQLEEPLASENYVAVTSDNHIFANIDLFLGK